MMDKDKCPYCGAETRPGDNFCLNCGNRLPTAAPSNASPNDATTPAGDDWAQHQEAAPDHTVSSWEHQDVGATIAEPGPEQSYADPTVPPRNSGIDQPARFILRAENGDVLQEYPLDKPEITIGRAPNSDILLSKDKLTSRRHATVRYENGTYQLRDERSANGTFVNGQQIEELAPVELKDGDHIGIGEHELIFHAFGSIAEHVEDLPTVSVPYEPPTYRTQDDSLRTVASSDDYGTTSIDTEPESEVQTGEETVAAPPEPVSPATNGSTPESVPATPQTVTAEEEPIETQQQVQPVAAIPIPSTVSYASASPNVATTARAATPVASAPTPSVTENVPMTTSSSPANVTFNRLNTLVQPNLPDITSLIAALSSLDGQVMSLQEQLNETQEAMRAHDAEVAQTANQLRSGVRKVSERMDNTIADVARNREALAWSELLQLMEDVMNNPRDIEYVTKLARKARELNKVFQLHQNVLNTMAECNSLLRGMITEDNR
jgi:pSer/pThr/pTyr-binding forkhead associated (FHA) protein